jgi:predicted Rossmann-fold nucleotide-binding protein
VNSTIAPRNFFVLAVVPGGIGTVLESLIISQLLQVRHLYDTPLVLVGPMWSELVDWARRCMLRPGFELAKPEDMAIPHCVDSADEAIARVRERHARRQQRRQYEESL